MKIKISLALVVLIFLISCTKESHISVPIVLEDKNTIDLKKYNKILFSDFNVNFSQKQFDTGMEIKHFFTNDFAKAIEKDVKVLNTDLNYYNDTNSFLNELKKNPGSLLLTGKMDIKIESRSVIKEIKSESGKKKKDFVQMKRWNMILEVVIIESDTGKIFFKRTFSEKMLNADPKNQEFNFNYLFFKNTNKFINELLKKKKIQKRYILRN